MNLFLDYFGLAIFSFVILIGGLVAYPALSDMPPLPTGEIIGLVLSIIVVSGGFSWYYFAASQRGEMKRRSSDPRQER